MSNILPHLLNTPFICGLAILVASGFLLVDGVRKSISDAARQKETEDAILTTGRKVESVSQAASHLMETKQDAPPPLSARLLNFLKSEIPNSLEGTHTQFDLELSDRQIQKLEGFFEEDPEELLISRRRTQRHNVSIGSGPNGESYRSFAFSISPKLKNP